jgi:hypothetical protein
MFVSFSISAEIELSSLMREENSVLRFSKYFLLERRYDFFRKSPFALNCRLLQ